MIWKCCPFLWIHPNSLRQLNCSIQRESKQPRQEPPFIQSRLCARHCADRHTCMASLALFVKSALLSPSFHSCTNRGTGLSGHHGQTSNPGLARVCVSSPNHAAAPPPLGQGSSASALLTRGPDNSSFFIGRVRKQLSCALQGAQQCPWSPPTRCQQHPFSSDHQTFSRHYHVSPGMQNHPRSRTTATDKVQPPRTAYYSTHFPCKDGPSIFQIVIQVSLIVCQPHYG